MIYFVGAGPGAADLITLRGRKLLDEADVIIYAGSLVSKAHLDHIKKTCEVHNSATMTLEEVLEVMIPAHREGKLVVRLHTGDPSIYGAIGEQMRALDEEGISYQIVPGVSSFVAANAVVQREMTLPGVSQTVILTRIKGRTPVPEKEELRSLAKHRASMAIFLSVKHMDAVVEELLTAYDAKTPVAVVYKATWPEEKVLRGRLCDIAEKVKAEDITKTAQILVGDFLDGEFDRSILYHEAHSTEYRQAKTKDEDTK